MKRNVIKGKPQSSISSLFDPIKINKKLTLNDFKSLFIQNTPSSIQQRNYSRSIKYNNPLKKNSQNLKNTNLSKSKGKTPFQKQKTIFLHTDTNTNRISLRRIGEKPKSNQELLQLRRAMLNSILSSTRCNKEPPKFQLRREEKEIEKEEKKEELIIDSENDNKLMSVFSFEYKPGN